MAAHHRIGRALLVACVLLAAVSARRVPNEHDIAPSHIHSSPSHPVHASTRIGVNDPNWYWTEHNWLISGDAFARTANNGAYFKIGFTGTSCVLGLLTPTLSSPYMNLRWTVDGLPYQHVTLPNTTSITLASGLKDGSHTLTLYTMNSYQLRDRWYVPDCVVTIEGLYLDSGAKTLPPTLRPKRMMVFWDSIGEGVRNNGTTGGDLLDNDSTDTSLMAAAAALNAEVSVVAFGGQGWTTTGMGNPPPLFTPGNDTNSAWNKFDAKHMRTNGAGQLNPNPDYIFCGHGTNDMWTSSTLVTAAAYGWLEAQRQASPNSIIFLTIPYGGWQRAAITAAYTNYMAKYKDTKCKLLDLGVSAQEGLVNIGQSTAYGTDGLHPTAARNGQLGAMLAVAAVNAMQAN